MPRTGKGALEKLGYPVVLMTAAIRSQCPMNVIEYRMGNQKRTIQRKWQLLKGAQDEEKQSKNTTQYVLDITICKQTHIT